MSAGDWAFGLTVFFGIPVVALLHYTIRYRGRLSRIVLGSGLVLIILGAGLVWTAAYIVYYLFTSDMREAKQG